MYLIVRAILKSVLGVTLTKPNLILGTRGGLRQIIFFHLQVTKRVFFQKGHDRRLLRDAYYDVSWVGLQH